MLPAPHRMRAGTEFQSAVRRGRRAGSRRVVLHSTTTTVGDGPRVGFVVSKAVGGSVVRHRVARRLRETVRPYLAAIPPDRLVVLRAQPAAASASFAELQADVAALFARIGIRTSPPDVAAGIANGSA